MLVIIPLKEYEYFKIIDRTVKIKEGYDSSLKEKDKSN